MRYIYVTLCHDADFWTMVVFNVAAITLPLARFIQSPNDSYIIVC
jgi:hypothetical protein